MGLDIAAILPLLTESERGAVERDDMELTDELHDEIFATPLLSAGVDGTFPGTDFAMYVCQWRGRYFAFSSDLDPEGPFETWKEAFDSMAESAAFSGWELDSETLTTAELLALIPASSVDPEEGPVCVNGRFFVYDKAKGEFVETNYEGTLPWHGCSR